MYSDIEHHRYFLCRTGLCFLEITESIFLFIKKGELAESN
jgi:hypothetical protein